jgi:biotin carboxyl carrier protein
VLMGVLAVLATALILRPAGGGGAEEADGDEPIVAPSRVVQSDGEPRVVLDTAEARRIGLTTAVLSRARAQDGRRLSAQVIPEPERTATVRAPVAGRLTAEPGQWPALGERVRSGEALGRVSDAQPLAVPLTGTVAAVGARPGEIVEAGQMLLELADNSRPVVRVAWPAEAGRPPDALVLVHPEGGSVGATLVGAAPEADPLTRQPTYLYRARAGWPGAVPGTPVTAMLSDGEFEGVFVPDAAVVQWEGLAWVYLLRRPGEFARVRVATERPAKGGWIVGEPIEPGDTVVVTGVQELLSEEFRAQVTVGEESGE